jgi:hypothetical protein
MLRSPVTVWVTVWVLVAVTGRGSIAFAQGSSGDKAAADALFDEGKKLLAAGDAAHACPKFETSLKLFDQLGTRLNLADCYEKAGRTASAWAEFREAASLADKRGDRRSKFARDRAAALQPRLVKLAIIVPPASRLPGLAVRRDGVAVPAELFDTPVPVDPGKYTVDAAASGYQGWSTTVDAATPGAELKVEVPKLAVVPREPAPEVPRVVDQKLPKITPAGDIKVEPSVKASDEDQPVDSGARRRRHLVSYAVGGAGVVALGIGVVLGLEAKHKWDQAGSHCAGSVCDATGASIDSDARSLGNTGTIVGGIGLAAAATAVVLYLTAPPARAVAEHTSFQLLPRSGGVMTWTTRF